MTIYLTTTEVLAIHYILIEKYGGTHGLRDPGSLDAALYRPQSGFYSDTIEKAAALWESLTENHPFLDGNKRTGFAAADVFLRVNGYKITVDSETIFKFIDTSLSSNKFEYKHLTSFLRKHTKEKK